MSGQPSRGGRRYWVLGGRWVDDATHLPWPRVYGPFQDYQAARTNADDLNGRGDEGLRFLVVADVPEGIQWPRD